jgi:predicted metal-dependent hydrolase
VSHLQVDELAFELRLSRRRKTLEITVDRGGELVLSAPIGVTEACLCQFVREKRFWIYQKLTEKAQRQRTVPRKQYVDGEGFLYLGRSYRLKRVDDQKEPLKLIGGRFCLRRDAVGEARTHFIRWYSERGRDWLTGKMAEHASRMEVAPAGVRVQELGYRWGSCGKGRWLYFHWKTILLPRTGLGGAIEMAQRLRRSIAIRRFVMRGTGDVLSPITISVGVAESRSNVVPLLKDARAPERYAHVVESEVDLVVQDVATRGQARVAAANRRFLADDGRLALAIKARSEDVTADPETVYDRVLETLEADYEVLESASLSPQHADHLAVVATPQR